MANFMVYRKYPVVSHALYKLYTTKKIPHKISCDILTKKLFTSHWWESYAKTKANLSITHLFFWDLPILNVPTLQLWHSECSFVRKLSTASGERVFLIKILATIK